MILHKRLGFVPVMYETPGVTSGGQGGAPAAVQSPAGGQGEAAGQPSTVQQGDGFNWGLFPNVPEEQRALLQPHLRDTLGYVNRMEEQYAPFKPIIGSGVQPEALQGYVAFGQNFERDPVGTWLDLGMQMQQAGELSEDLGFEEIRAILDGTVTQEPVMPEGVDPNEQTGMLMATIEELRGRLDEREQRDEQERTQKQQQQEDRLYRSVVQRMRTDLVREGFPDELITNELLAGQLIAHRGDPDSVVRAMTGLRNGTTRAAIERHTKQPNEITAPRGAPPAAKRDAPRDPWAKARDGAKQFLGQQENMAE